MGLYILSYRVAGPLMLMGPGDRLPASPAPGAVPRGEPLLPRIETLIGALAPIAIGELRGGRPPGSCDEVPRIVAEWLTGGACLTVAGPFLRLRTRRGTRVYVNVYTHLLDLEALDKYVELFELKLEAFHTPNPSLRHRLLDQAAALVEELEDEGLLIPWEAVAQRRQRHALNYSTKTVIHGHLFTETRIDYTQIPAYLKDVNSMSKKHEEDDGETEGGLVVEPPELILLVAAPRLSEVKASVSLTPLKTPARLEVREAQGPEHLLAGCGDELLVLSNSPIELYECRALHPLNPRPKITIHATTCRTCTGFSKTEPREAYQPGTMLYECEECTPLEQCHALRAVYALPIDALKEIHGLLKGGETDRKH